MNEEFYQAVERAIEIEIKSNNDEFYRHETPDSDLYTLLRDHELVGIGWEKNRTITSALKRAYVINKCKSADLALGQYFLT